MAGILAARPDWNRSGVTNEYSQCLAEALYLAGDLEDDIGAACEMVERLGDLRTGLPGVCKYLPTPYDVRELSETIGVRMAAERRQRARILEGRVARRFVPLPHGSVEKFRPFPRLWEAFANDSEAMALLDSGLPFDRLFGASRALATQGPEAARAMLVVNQVG